MSSFSSTHLMSGGQVLNHMTQDGRQWLPHLRQLLGTALRVSEGVRRVGRFALSSKFLLKGVQEANEGILKRTVTTAPFVGVGGFEATKSFSLIHQELVSTKLLSFSYWLPHSTLEDECCQEFVPISAEKGRDLVFGGATKQYSIRLSNWLVMTNAPVFESKETYILEVCENEL